MKAATILTPAALFAAGAFATGANAASVDYYASYEGTDISVLNNDFTDYTFYLNSPEIDFRSIASEALVELPEASGSYLEGNFSGFTDIGDIGDVVPLKAAFLPEFNKVGPRSDTAYYPTPDQTLNKSQDTSIDGYYGLQFQQNGKTYLANALVDMNGTHIGEINVQSAVPELGTWALMLVGFGGVGAALRRPRRQSGRALAA